MERLVKFLASTGVASRRQCEEIIRSGVVTVNGSPVLLPQALVNPSVDRVEVEGHPVSVERKLYYILNKPKGYVCSTVPTGRARPVLDLFGGLSERLFSVGRLDVDTTGLLLVTNDGDFAQRVIHPREMLQKEYLVKTREMILASHLERLQAGMWIEGMFVRPIRVQKQRRGTVKIVVGEGRKHEVRRLCRAAGLTIWDLHRIRIGNLRLGNLPLGVFKALSARDCECVFD